MAAQFGFQGSLKLNRWGWYPKGGGEAIANIQPTSEWRGADLRVRGKLKEIRGISAASNLPTHVLNRQRSQSQKCLARLISQVNIDLVEGESIGQGTLVFLKAEFENGLAGFSALGARGKRAEKVADEVCQELEDFLASDTAIEPHLADQLVLPMALAKEESRFTTSRITRHLTTNIWLIQQFLPVRFEVTGAQEKSGEVVKRESVSG
jgi:RNA 3'-terminal phosphate cyclase (ATP)